MKLFNFFKAKEKTLIPINLEGLAYEKNIQIKIKKKKSINPLTL